MLLEMANSDLFHLLESPAELDTRIQEALQLLAMHDTDGDA